jgi:hypothetical protein
MRVPRYEKTHVNQLDALGSGHLLPGTTPLVAMALMEMAVSIVCKETGGPSGKVCPKTLQRASSLGPGLSLPGS